MKANNRQKGSVTGPILKDLMDREKVNVNISESGPTVGSKPLAPPALYEDAGEGYNEDFTFPQE
jgi:hypothetical protein